MSRAKGDIPRDFSRWNEKGGKREEQVGFSGEEKKNQNGEEPREISQGYETFAQTRWKSGQSREVSQDNLRYGGAVL